MTSTLKCTSCGEKMIKLEGSHEFYDYECVNCGEILISYEETNEEEPRIHTRQDDRG